MLRTLVFWLENLAAGAFLWFGLYLITREIPPRRAPGGPGWWQRLPALWAGTAMSMTALFFFGVALRSVATTAEEYVRWIKWTWWGMPIAVVLWLWVVVFLLAEEGQWRNYPLWERVILPAVLAYGIFISVAGTFTEFIRRYRETHRVTTFMRFIIPPNLPAYYLYGVFFVGTLWVATGLLWHQCRKMGTDTRRLHGFRWLAWGGLFLALGATVNIVSIIRWPGHVPEEAGDLIAVVGLILAARGIVSYGALVRNQILKVDFLHSLAGVAAVVALYILVFQVAHRIGGYPPPPASIPVLIGLAILTHTLFDWGRSLLDRVLLPRWAADYRWRLLELRREILKAPDPREALETAEREFAHAAQEARRSVSQEVIRQEIERIFSHATFWKDGPTAESRLFHLEVVQRGLRAFARARGMGVGALSRRERAEFLRAFLTGYVEQLCPAPGEEPPTPPSPEWIEYLILRRKYVAGESRGEVKAHIRELGLRITGGTYYRHLNNARRRLAALIWEAEMEVAGGGERRVGW